MATRAWFRSAEMEYVSLVVQEHAAHQCVATLGRMGVIEFTDLNPELTAFQRRYVKEIQRADELERKLRYFDEQLEKSGIEPVKPPSVDEFLDKLDSRQERMSRATSVLDELENLLEEKEKELQSLVGYASQLTSEYNARLELLTVLEKAKTLGANPDEDEGGVPLKDVVETEPASSQMAVWSGAPEESGRTGASRLLRFSNITGVLPAADRARFERMVFRATRGNCYMRFSVIDEPIKDPTTGLLEEKIVFIIFYQSPYVEAKLKKICDAFSAHLYAVPDIDDPAELSRLMRETTTDLEEREQVMNRNQENCEKLLGAISTQIINWRWTVQREKAVYHNLNHFKSPASGLLRVEGWVVANALNSVADAIRKVHDDMDSSSRRPPTLLQPLPRHSWPEPPTHFEVNKFTVVFQDITDTYGVPHYREANPALFTSVTFPFLFGVMYGDIGHGLCLFSAALFVVLREKQFAKANMGEIFDMVFGGRYLILLMGFFAVYCGFIYNDCFSIGLRLFTPMWKDSGSNFTRVTATGATCGPSDDDCYVYPFGTDPTWKIADNELLYANSLKMKMSVILGVSQMAVGVGLKISNALYRRDTIDLVFEAIPQMIFLLSLFGYMNLLIIMKWTMPWLEHCNRDNCVPPSIITTMINMALSPTSVKDPIYSGQLGVQIALVLIAVLMVPLMLFPKPIMKFRQAKREREARGFAGDRMPSASSSRGGGGYAELSVMESSRGEEGERLVATESSSHSVGHSDHEEHDFSEMFIHQAIETIEFVLGCISNTASYLRLWALSLAHSQLAAVFWEKAILGGLKTSGFAGVLMTFVGFSVFAGITTGVLLLMDVLECFLHALRLHWVEFQNKFYKADGHKFQPLNFGKEMSA